MSHPLIIEIIKMQIQFIRTAPDPGASSGAEIAIQELLSLCKVKGGDVVVTEVWEHFSEDERTVLLPFLTSRYQWNLDTPQGGRVFSRSQTYEQWLGEWGEYLATCLPISKGRMFLSCRIAMHHNTRLAQFLLPHLVLRLLLFGTTKDKEEIVAEIVDILRTSSSETLSSDSRRNQNPDFEKKKKVISATFFLTFGDLFSQFLGR